MDYKASGTQARTAAFREVTVASAPRGGVCWPGGEGEGRKGQRRGQPQLVSDPVVLLEFLSCPASFGHPVSKSTPNSHSFLDSAAMCWPQTERTCSRPGGPPAQQGQAKDTSSQGLRGREG